MYIVKNFLYPSTKPLACMLFKSFIVSLVMYRLPVLYPAMYQRDKKDIRKIFKDTTSQGLELGLILTPCLTKIVQKSSWSPKSSKNRPSINPALVNNQTKPRIMQIYMDDEHFMQELLEPCPSGRLRHPKYQTARGKDCFLLYTLHNKFNCNSQLHWDNCAMTP